MTTIAMACRQGKKSRAVLLLVYEFLLRLQEVDFDKQSTNYKQCCYERLRSKLSLIVPPNQWYQSSSARSSTTYFTELDYRWAF